MQVPGLRSCHDTVGGIVYFGRMLDKIRLQQRGELPADYQPNLGKGFDDRCCQFLRVQYPALVTRVNQGGTDADILAWCFHHGRQPAPAEIEVWNGFMTKRGWQDEASAILTKRLREGGLSHRTDILTMFDYIDVDEGRPLRVVPTARDLLAEADRYIEQLCVPADDVLETALRESTKAGLPEIHVSPTEGRLLYLLAKLNRSQRILEIGLLAGYSTICLARALPDDGKLVSLELDPHHAAVAKENLQRAGLLAQVEIRVGNASTLLEQMVAAGEPPFDLIFIDADKVGYPAYLDWSMRLVHPGSLILADNLIRGGAVMDPDVTDASLRATQEFNRRLAAHPRLESIIVPVVRPHLDGLAIARVR